MHNETNGDGERATEREPKWTERQVLRHTWASFRRILCAQPLDAIRRYFGEQVAFYFAWLGFYTQMLIFPTLLGVGCFVYSLSVLNKDATVRETCTHPGNVTLCPTCVPPNCDFEEIAATCHSTRWSVIFDNSTTVVIGICSVLWITVFQKAWIRKEADLASRWDALGPERIEEDIRPQYEARARSVCINPVTRRQEPYITPALRYRWFSCSIAALLLLIACVIIALVALVPVKILICGLFKTWGGFFAHNSLELSKMAIDFLTFLVVMALTWVYEKGAHRLTEHECPRTHADYLSSFIWKLYIFEMLNNFIPVFYVAFIKGCIATLPNELSYFREMCDPGGCINEVVSTVSILLLFRLIVSNAAELGIPLLCTILKKHAAENAGETTTRWRDDYQLMEHELDGVYREYMEMLVQYAFVALFSPVFPLLPLMCFLNNLVEIRLDAVNFVISHRRPLPIRVSGIGIWKQCLDIINKTAVLCNGALIAFTSDFVPTLVYIFFYSEDGTQTGYVTARLSRFHFDDWPNSTWDLTHHNNITECYYVGYHCETPPYNPTNVWWRIMTLRLSFFLLFTILCFLFQWLCNFFIPDVPLHVQIREERAKYLVKMTLYNQGNKRQQQQPTQSTLRENREKPRLNSHKGTWKRKLFAKHPNRLSMDKEKLFVKRT